MSDWIPERWRGVPRGRQWRNMLFKDHCLVRWPIPNAHRVTDEFWRAGQPLPFHFARWRRRGIRTVVNLRGPVKFASWVLAREAAERQGLAYVNYGLRSRDLPTREELLGLLELLDGAQYPLLIHCKSGSDRTGLVAGIYLIHRRGATPAEALRQLRFKYLHMKSGKAGVLRLVITAFAESGERDFRRWVETAYDPAPLAARWGEWTWRGALFERLLRRE